MQLRHQIEYAITAALLGLCRMLPERGVYALFRGIGRLMSHLIPARTRLCMTNLAIAFPEMPAAERRRLVQRVYANLAESMAFNTLLMGGKISNERILGMVETEGWEHYERALTLTGKGLLVFSAHIGNWELMPQYAALRLGRKLHVIARETTNPLLEQHIVAPLRARFGVNVFYKKNAMIHMIKALNRGEHCGLLIDQKLGRKDGILVDFFGRPAPTIPTPALLQVRFGVVALPAFMVKVAPGRYRLVIKEPLTWTDNGKPQEEQVRELTTHHQQIIEQIIRDYPDQWFWVHNRWGLKKGEL